MRRLVLTFMIMCCSIISFAQSDTVVLSDITIIGQQWQAYAAGVKINKLTPDSLMVGQSLADVLQVHGLAYLKTYGSGQLSTLNIRGTGASQNAIFWQGINTNVTSLGLSDFSLTPMSLIDGVSLQYGAGSSLLGSDVIGGSVHVSTMPVRSNSLTTTISQGSFGLWAANAKAHYYRNNWIATTRVFYQSSENDFPFENEAVSGNPKSRMENAAFDQWGLSQDLWYNINKRHQLSVHLWYHLMDRQIQPGLYTTQFDQQNDESARGLIQWTADYGRHKGTLKVAQLQDRIDFNGDVSVMPRSYFSYEHEYFGGDKWSLRAGVNWQVLSSDIDAYQAEISENRQDLFFSVGWYPTARLNVSANLRQSFVEGFDPPITPSVGWSFMVNNWLNWTGNIARSYRVPTLNDRYWTPGGNPNILPELGDHVEMGLEVIRDVFSHQLSTYYGDVTDWIVWLPQEGFWSPENIDQVQIFGVEYEGYWDISKRFGIHVSYAFNKSIRKSGVVDAFENKQLPYVPEHQVKWNLTYQYKWWSISGDGQWISQRFANADNSVALDAFMMLGLNATAQVRDAWSFQIRANNLTNQKYQLVLNRPMPGRNYQITIQHHINFKKGS